MEVNACTCFIVNDNKEVLVEKRTNKGIDSGELDLCSGHVEKDELPMQTMIRELKEELGIQENTSCNLEKIGEVLVDFKNKSRDVQYITTVYMLPYENINLQDLVLQHEEVDSVSFVNYLEVLDMLRKNKMRFPYHINMEKILQDLERRICKKEKQLESFDEGR